MTEDERWFRMVVDLTLHNSLELMYPDPAERLAILSALEDQAREEAKRRGVTLPPSQTGHA